METVDEEEFGNKKSTDFLNYKQMEEIDAMYHRNNFLIDFLNIFFRSFFFKKVMLYG